MLKYKKHLFASILIICFFLPSVFSSCAQAQTSIMQSDELKGHIDDGKYELDDFINIAIVVAKIIWGISGSLALLAFVFGGFMMLTSAGVAERVTKGRQAIVGGAIGLAIIFGSYTIVDFIIKNMLGQSSFSFSSGWF